MKITLRKANALQTSISELINSIVLNCSVEVDEFQSVEDAIKSKHDLFQRDFERKSKLFGILYEIRQVISAANASSGVSAKLTEIAYLTKIIEMVNAITLTMEETESLDIL